MAPPPRSAGCVERLCVGVADLATGGAEVVVCDVADFVRPDLLAVDALARMQLTARRHGSSIRLRHANGALTALLWLAGLEEVVREEVAREAAAREAAAREAAAREAASREEVMGREAGDPTP